MRAVAALLVLQAFGASASFYDTLFPSAEPTITRDPRECLLEDFYTYIEDAPMPTSFSALWEALNSYGDKLQEDCPYTSRDIFGWSACPFPAYSDWCSFSNVAPTTLIPEWSSFGSQASSWWAQHSSAMVDWADFCPNKWFDTMGSVILGPLRLNNTIAWAACHAEANPTTELKAAKTPAPTAAGSHPTMTKAPETTTPTATANGVVPDAEMWFVAGVGLAVAAMNSLM